MSTCRNNIFIPLYNLITVVVIVIITIALLLRANHLQIGNDIVQCYRFRSNF